MSEAKKTYFWGYLTSPVVKKAIAYIGEFTSAKIAEVAANKMFPGRVLEIFDERILKEKMNEL